MIYKPMCVYGIFNGFCAKSDLLRTCEYSFARKRLMRSKRIMRTTYSFARKATYVLEAAYA